MNWLEWIVGALIAGIALLVLATNYARAWSGELVGSLRVTMWDRNDLGRAAGKTLAIARLNGQK